MVKDYADDNRIVECAVSSRSAAIITNDGDLLRMSVHDGSRMMRVGEFLRELEQGRGTVTSITIAYQTFSGSPFALTRDQHPSSFKESQIFILHRRLSPHPEFAVVERGTRGFSKSYCGL